MQKWCVDVSKDYLNYTNWMELHTKYSHVTDKHEV